MDVYDKQAKQWVPLRKTRAYQRRKRQLRDVWIGLGAIMVLLPLAPQLILALLGAFFSFFYLDEVPYPEFYDSE